MSSLFSEILRMSVSGSVVILTVIVLRLILKKAPRSLLCLLWLLVALRLTVPIRIESVISLQPELPQRVTQQTPPVTLPDMVPAIPDVGELPDDVEISISDSAVSDEETIVYHNAAVIPAIWLIGVSCMWVYGFCAWISVKKRVKNAVIHSEGIWISGSIDTAFVFGLLRPIIYLPAQMGIDEQSYILAHERSHIRRGDHWWKLIGFGVLSIHWFNPLVWVAYLLLCRDIEIASDERVVKNMDTEERKRYSAALLACSMAHKGIAACPVAFAENSVKVRIKSVLNYKKPSFWIILVCVAALAVVAVCLLTSPAQADPLEQCRQALEYHQAEAARKITVVAEYSGTNVPEYPVEHTYWRYGQNYLVKWYIDDGHHRPGWLLKANGETYCYGIAPYFPEGNTDYQSWTVTDKIPEEDFTDWLDEYQWDMDEITLIKAEKTDDNLLVTFTVAGEFRTTDNELADQRTVTFCIGDNGRLLSAKHQTTYYDGTTAICTCTHTSTISYDEQTIRGMIMGRIQEVPAPHTGS